MKIEGLAEHEIDELPVGTRVTDEAGDGFIKRAKNDWRWLAYWNVATDKGASVQFHNDDILGGALLALPSDDEFIVKRDLLAWIENTSHTHNGGSIGPVHRSADLIKAFNLRPNKRVRVTVELEVPVNTRTDVAAVDDILALATDGDIKIEEL